MSVGGALAQAILPFVGSALAPVVPVIGPALPVALPMLGKAVDWAIDKYWPSSTEQGQPNQEQIGQVHSLIRRTPFNYL